MTKKKEKSTKILKRNEIIVNTEKIHAIAIVNDHPDQGIMRNRVDHVLDHAIVTVDHVPVTDQDDRDRAIATDDHDHAIATEDHDRAIVTTPTSDHPGTVITTDQVIATRDLALDHDRLKTNSADLARKSTKPNYSRSPKRTP